jgi:hypothetical protein
MTKVAAVPVRFWWLKRLTAAGMLLVIILLWVRLWWGWIAQRRLDAEIAAAKALGEPIRAEDFAAAQPPPPTAQNAVPVLQAAVASVAFNPAQSAFSSRFDPTLPISDADRKMLHGLVTVNAKAIALARSMVDLPGADWGVRLTTPLVYVPVPRFSGQTQLATLMRDSVIDEHIHGDDAGALKDVRAIFRQADVLDDAGPFFIAHLASIVVDGLAADTVRQITGELHIGDGRASAQQVRNLIRQILDDHKYVSVAARGWYLERAELLEAPGLIPTLSKGPDYWEYLVLKPMLQLDVARKARHMTAVAHALQEPNFSSASAKLPPDLTALSLSPLHVLARSFSYSLGPVNSRNLVFRQYQELTDRRVAAVFLAIRLYETDHGSPPTDLAALVPDYLPEVPIDPLSPDGHVLRFISTPGKQAVYSVGIDGQDDGGSTRLPAPTSGQSSNPWNMRDAVFPLHPATAP